MTAPVPPKPPAPPFTFDAWWQKWRDVVVGVALFVALVVFLRGCGSKPATLPASTVVRIDSVRVTDPAAKHQADSLAKVTHALADSIHRSEAAHTVALSGFAAIQNERDSLKAVVLSLPVPPAPDPRVPVLESLVKADSAALGILTRTVTTDSTTIRLLTAQVGTLAADTTAKGARLKAIESLNQQITKDLAKATTCHIVLGVPCPTRGEAYLGGAGTVLAILLAVKR